MNSFFRLRLSSLEIYYNRQNYQKYADMNLLFLLFVPLLENKRNKSYFPSPIISCRTLDKSMISDRTGNGQNLIY